MRIGMEYYKGLVFLALREITLFPKNNIKNPIAAELRGFMPQTGNEEIAAELRGLTPRLSN